ncbi:HK97 gp10 family phage protein [Streptosporangium saharense]|uniref:HK97 gp10 family phage protein n=1 Tax=Streptosporangium saharense TaxID=1706840 RepID=UPI0033287A05
MAGGRGVHVDFDEAELQQLLHGPDGPVARHLARCGEIVTQGAKRRAPVSSRGSGGRPSGYLRSKIGWQLGRDAIGLYVEVASPARTPQGEPYGLFVEVGTRPHVIRPKNPNGWLRWAGSDGKVHLAKVVHHPGTRAQPHLRPALEDLRGA